MTRWVAGVVLLVLLQRGLETRLVARVTRKHGHVRRK